jgi:hypothetical protein
MVKAMAFCNSTIKPFRKSKPHIVFRQGYWRVSKVPHGCAMGVYRGYVKAHDFVAKLNKNIAYEWGYENGNKSKNSQG